MRYDYAGPYKTEDRAQAVLEDAYATGDVLPAEFPRIERRGGKVASWAKAQYRWYITVGDAD